MNIKYNSTISEKKVKQVQDLLYSIFEDDEIVNHWLKVHGLSILTNKHEKLYILTGKGGNGKSLLMNFFRECLGDYFDQTESNFLTSQKNSSTNSTLANCQGIRVLAVTEPQGDTADDAVLNGEHVKSVTGRDPLTARDLYKTNVTYVPVFNRFLLCNSLPSIKKLDNGIIRRLEIMRLSV